MELQQIFDRVATHLLRQGKPALVRGGCAYLAPDGKQCAVGCLIARDHYHPAIEGRRVTHAEVVVALGRSGIPTDSRTLELLTHLQYVHDHVSPSGWKSALRHRARALGLHSDVVESPLRRAPSLVDLPYDANIPMHELTVRYHVDPATGWKTPIYEPIKPPRELYHPYFVDDAHEKAERAARHAVKDVVEKAQAAIEKDLTRVQELLT